MIGIISFALTSCATLTGSSSRPEPDSERSPASSNREAAEAKKIPWGGDFWPMLNNPLVRGWKSATSGKRTLWEPEDIQDWDACLEKIGDKKCDEFIEKSAFSQGAGLPPLLKFDLWMRKNVTAFASAIDRKPISHAAKRELEIHHIGETDRNHRHSASAGFAGKCLGWALSTFDWDEPTGDALIDGIVFTPADIKGILATIYNGAQFFIPDSLVVGNEVRLVGESAPGAEEDLTPVQFVKVLRESIGKGHLLEADLDPTTAVWNHPIYAYELSWKWSTKTLAQVQAKIRYANDLVDRDGVFSTSRQREDLIERELEFELTVPESARGDIGKATAGKWSWFSLGKFPDAAILGMEQGWREKVYKYRNTSMKKEVNFELLKRVQVNGKWVPAVDILLKRYYEKIGNRKPNRS